MLSEYIELRMKEPLFTNTRRIKNVLDRARMRQANLRTSEAQLTKADLIMIQAEDICGSRLFIKD